MTTTPPAASPPGSPSASRSGRSSRGAVFRPPSPQRIIDALGAAADVRQMLGNTEDAQLIADTIEGETDAFEVLDRLAELWLADTLVVERGRERLRRLEARADRLHDTISRMLQALDLGAPLERAFYTASLAYTRPVQIIRESAIPEQFIRHAPDKLAIGMALRRGEHVEGAVLGNDEPRLTVRTK